MKLFKTIDEKFEEIGFIKVEEKSGYVHYQRYNKEYSYVHTLYFSWKSNGKHIVQSYDENLMDTKGIGNTCVGLSMYEMKLCIKKMKEKGLKPIKK